MAEPAEVAITPSDDGQCELLIGGSNEGSTWVRAERMEVGMDQKLCPSANGRVSRLCQCIRTTNEAYFVSLALECMQIMLQTTCDPTVPAAALAPAVVSLCLLHSITTHVLGLLQKLRLVSPSNSDSSWGRCLF